MTLNGKRDGFTFADFHAGAKSAVMKRGRAEAIVEQVIAAARRWPEFANQAKVAESRREEIGRNHRLAFATA
jgi:serine/threonine-protein kinase HipA